MDILIFLVLAGVCIAGIICENDLIKFEKKCWAYIVAVFAVLKTEFININKGW